MSELTPKQIVAELDKHIIGQNNAKRAVAIALRNRWRRMQVPENMRSEITPKNILMIGPTGVGKTEIARRLAKLSNAPFIKVEATKFTEVGYVGREVDSIIRDLTDVAVKQAREKALEVNRKKAESLARERILDALLPASTGNEFGFDETESAPTPAASDTREKLGKKLDAGDFDARSIEIKVSVQPMGVEIMTPPGMEDMSEQLQGLFDNLSTKRSKTRKLPIKEAWPILIEEEAGKLVNEEEIKLKAVSDVEEHGIVFLDEIDKVAKNSNVSGGDVSREGVQRDLLPLVEGSTVGTRYGMVKTDHILFIASGAFHVAKPSDLIPELQGRFPIRVELSALSAEDFSRILTEPDASLTQQYRALMSTENVMLTFKKDGIERLAQVAFSINERTENIGARRLHTVLERLLDDVSFRASDDDMHDCVIDAKAVDDTLADLAQDEDLSRYIL